MYIDANSNHPPPIIKQIPKSVSKRISNNSSNQEIFDTAAPLYNNILEKCGYSEKINYCPDTQPTSRKNRSRKVIWYNPPFSMNVETNVAKTFLALVRKHFPRYHKFNKIFNKNNVKVSYSCMDNMAKILKSHNAKLTKDENARNTACNCQSSRVCPLNGNCQVDIVVYGAVVIINEETPGTKYIGICDPFIKERIRNHYKAFNNRQYEMDTELSKFIWQLQDNGINNYEIKWSILRHVSGYNSVTNSCSLCTMEKVLISQCKDKDRLINKRMDLVTKCRHQNKHLLCNYSGID